MELARGAGWGPSLAAPDHRLQGGLQADFHVQRVGAPEVDVGVDVADDDGICQVEGVAVRGMCFILLHWGAGWGGEKGHEKLSRAQIQRAFLQLPGSCPPSFLDQKLQQQPFMSTCHVQGPELNARPASLP